MTTYDLAAYWPFDLVGTTKTRTFHYVDPTGVVPPWTSVFGYDAPANALVYLDSGPTGAWTDTWFLQAGAEGIIEVEDWYPQTSPELAVLFGTTKKIAFKTPIGWGSKVLGFPQTVINYPVYNAEACVPPFAASGSGQQTIVFEKHLEHFEYRDVVTYDDVIQFSYAQKWGNGTPTGARYWLAKGVGPIAVAWIAYNADGTLKAIEPTAYATVS
jgi:hypothetical protein